MIVCSKCLLEKPIGSFYKKGGGRIRGECKDCYTLDWKSRILHSVRSRELERKKKGMERETDISKAYLEELIRSQDGMCYWLGIPLDLTMGNKLLQPSLDRLDNSKGYIIGNVVLSSLFANTGRRCATENEMRDFVNTYIKKKTPCRESGGF